MDIVTIDLETYYDREYSLSKMTTEAYARDPRFEVVGVAIKVNGYPTDWYSGSDPGKFLRQLNYKDRAILCHNTAFDGAILSWKYGIRPKLWLDTMSMARPLHGGTIGVSLKALTAHYGLGEKGDEVQRTLGMRRADFSTEAMARYAEYCVKDVDLTYALFRRLAKGFPPKELQLIDLTLRMYTEPTLVVDSELLSTHLDEVVKRKQALLDTFAAGEDSKSILMSNDKFAAYLRECGIEPPMKISKTTGKETYAFSKTDSAFTSMAEHPDERVAVAVSARLGVKSTIEESRTRSLLGVAERGSLPIMLNYYGAHTGRFSGGDKMNLQNLPRGGALRRSLRAPDGKLLVACDSSQIEARVVAWLAGQADLLEAFAEGRDVYSEFATEVYGGIVKVVKSDKLERFVGKTCILGLGYGMGPSKFRESLALGMGGIKVHIDADEAIRIVRLYRDRNAYISMLWNRCGVALRHMIDGRQLALAPDVLPSLMAGPDGIELPNGLSIRYPALQITTSIAGTGSFVYAGDQRAFREALKAKVLGETVKPELMTRIYGGKVVENIVQAVARVVVSDQMVEISKRYKVVLQVHDEVVICCDEDEAEAAKAFMMGVMSTPPAWAAGLPVACEADVGKTYGDAK